MWGDCPPRIMFSFCFSTASVHYLSLFTFFVIKTQAIIAGWNGEQNARKDVWCLFFVPFFSLTRSTSCTALCFLFSLLSLYVANGGSNFAGKIHVPSSLFFSVWGGQAFTQTLPSHFCFAFLKSFRKIRSDFTTTLLFFFCDQFWRWQSWRYILIMTTDVLGWSRKNWGCSIVRSSDALRHSSSIAFDCDREGVYPMRLHKETNKAPFNVDSNMRCRLSITTPHGSLALTEWNLCNLCFRALTTFNILFLFYFLFLSSFLLFFHSAQLHGDLRMRLNNNAIVNTVTFVSLNSRNAHMNAILCLHSILDCEGFIQLTLTSKHNILINIFFSSFIFSSCTPTYCLHSLSVVSGYYCVPSRAC